MLAEDKEDHAQHKADEYEKKKKKKIDETWEGFNIIEDHLEIIKKIFEDSNQGSPWVRSQTRQHLNK